ncbi:methyl-CpG-binding domain-containing protein 2 isoform X2 [Elaeis guineensis]|uniref:Methyl-CpG-binding domain-containing protein 2 isoform X2 n=1 Tax=Elaeis guineensis var. tenera TaxID=51953 RepID=A0A6I9RNQ8_ELAGV|nr:methyl-CpG-binding domain-containing protein 2 isoform X2 [Elaeis guineensis]
MQSNLEDARHKPKKECLPWPSKSSRKRSFGDAEVDAESGGDQSLESASNQLVLYNPDASDSGQDALEVTEYTENHNSSLQNFTVPNSSSRVLPSVGAFTVQCASCFKWRLIPTKEKYEEIRETILQEPFTCERAREWRPDISCEDPTDISQDGSRLWAIDKPNIAQPPRGWERLLRIRGEGSTRFADVHLKEHPGGGVNKSQFSFQIPKPLQENYVRKRSSRVTNPCDGAGLGSPRPLEPEDVNPLSWAAPTRKELESGGLGSSIPSHGALGCFPPDEPAPLPPAKKKTTGTSSRHMYDSSVYDQPKIKLEDA